MTAHLLVLYPHPKNVGEFDRAYREEHLPYAGSRLAGATSVITKRVVGPGFSPPPYHLISDVSFPGIGPLRRFERRSGSLGARRVDQLRRRSDDRRGRR